MQQRCRIQSETEKCMIGYRNRFLEVYIKYQIFRQAIRDEKDYLQKQANTLSMIFHFFLRNDFFLRILRNVSSFFSFYTRFSILILFYISIRNN